jgi:hypothetical protein
MLDIEAVGIDLVVVLAAIFLAPRQATLAAASGETRLTGCPNLDGLGNLGNTGTSKQGTGLANAPSIRR